MAGGGGIIGHIWDLGMQHSLQDGANNAPGAISAQENGAREGRSPSSSNATALNRIGPLLFKKAAPCSFKKPHLNIIRSVSFQGSNIGQ